MRGTRVETVLPDELMARLDTWRARQEVPPSRSAAVAQAIKRFLLLVERIEEEQK